MLGKVLIDYSELKGKIKSVYDTQEAFADAMGMSRVTLNQRLSNDGEFKTSEIVNACLLLGIDLNDAHRYFFTERL